LFELRRSRRRSLAAVARLEPPAPFERFTAFAPLRPRPLGPFAQFAWFALVVTAVAMLVGRAALAAAAAQRPAPDESWLYRIQRGDTLIGLHGRLLKPEADWRVVQRLNRVADPHRLMPGSTLRIPLALLREEPERAEVLQLHGQAWIERSGGAREPLAAAAALQSGDVIGTGAQSSLSLRFADGSRAQLGPHGRLQLQRHVKLGASGRTNTQLRLESGGAEVQVAPAPAGQAVEPMPQRAGPRPTHAAPPALPPAPFELRTPVVNLGVRGTEFRARVDAERTLAEVTQGRVTAGEQGVEAGFGVVATASGVAPPRALLPAPDLSALPARVERVPLQLVLPRSQGAARWRAQVFGAAAPGHAGAPLLLEGLFEQPLAAWSDDLPDGRYELRVRAADADGIEGLAASAPFTLKARPEPPFLLRPRAGDKLVDESVTLAWARNPEAARYRLQVAGDSGFTAPTVQRDDLTATELSVALPLGTHHWRVGSVRADGDAGPWGDPQVFERTARPPPPPPPAAPAANAPRPAAEGLQFSWAASPVPGASYQVQIARDAAFTQIVRDERTSRTDFVLPEPAPGVYHLRVRTIGVDGRAGSFGAAQQVEVPRSWWWLWLLPLLLLL
jgi:hypothetical protein